MRARLRASKLNGFSPLSVSGCVLWLDCSVAASITSSGGAISQIADQSGNGNHANQSTAGSKPTLGTDATTGLGKATFDGTDDALIVTDANSLDLTTGLTIMCALKVLTSGNANRYLVTKDPALSFNAYGIFSTSDGTNMQAWMNGAAFAAINGHSYAGRRTWTMLYDKTNLYGRHDLTANASMAYSTNITTNAQDLWIGARNAASTALNFELYELIIWNSGLSNANRDAAEAYLKAKWATT